MPPPASDVTDLSSSSACTCAIFSCIFCTCFITPCMLGIPIFVNSFPDSWNTVGEADGVHLHDGLHLFPSIYRFFEGKSKECSAGAGEHPVVDESCLLRNTLPEKFASDMLAQGGLFLLIQCRYDSMVDQLPGCRLHVLAMFAKILFRSSVLCNDDLCSRQGRFQRGDTGGFKLRGKGKHVTSRKCRGEEFRIVRD